jgi:glycosyltransferase involved in cell wall biosynthesis
LQKQGISIHILERQLGFDIALIKSLYNLIKANQYDVIHCHQYTPYVYGLSASILTSAKVIFTEHGRFYPDYGTRKRQIVNPVFSMFTAKITSISQATKNALVKFEGFNAKKIEVIYNGIADKSDIEVDQVALKTEFGIPQLAFIFGTISRLQPIKNQSMMIKAFKQVHDQDKNTHLLIVGDGEIRLVLEALAQTLGLKSHVTFTGFQKDPYHFYRIIDVFLLSSFSEGTSMTLLEALSFSVPCVVTDVGGNPEIIDDRVNGRLTPNNDESKFKITMVDMKHDLSTNLECKKQCRSTYESRFTVESMVISFSNLYLDIC